MRIIKAFNLESEMRKRMTASIRIVERSANRMATGGASAALITDSLAGVVIGFAIFYGSWRITIGHGDVGAFGSFLAALMLAYEPMKRLGRINVDIQNGLVSTRLIYEVLDAPQGEPAQTRCRSSPFRAARIAIEKARFAYRPGEYVIDGLDLVAEPNETTALVGPSGGGKTTILGIIQRFYALNEGRVTIDDQDVSMVDLASLRDKIAFVSQDVFLFRGSIRDNIAVGRFGATEEEIVEAARKAHAHDFILQFAAGYDTNVGEQGAPALRRPAPTHRHCARDPQRCADPAARRADGGARLGIGARGAEGVGRPARRPHDTRRRPSPSDHCRFQQDLGHRRRPRGRNRRAP